MMPLDLPPWPAVFRQMRRWLQAGCFEPMVHAALDTLGQLQALHVTHANEQDREQVGQLAQAVREISGQSVEMAYVDQGYSGSAPEQAAQTHGIQLEVVKHPEAKCGFVLRLRR